MMIRRLDMLGLILLAVATYTLYPLSDTIVMGIVTAYGLRVLVEDLSEVIDRQVVEYSLLTGLVVVTTAGLYFTVVNVSSVAVELIQLTQSLIANIQSFLAPYELPLVSEYLSQALSAASGYIRQQIFGIVASLPWVILELLTFLLVVHYLYLNWAELAAKIDEIIDRLPEEDARILFRVKETIQDLVRNVFVVYGTFAIIMTFIGGVGYYIIGLAVTGAPIPFYWAWGILIGIAAFLEGIGSIIFTGPLIIYYFAVGEVWLAFWLTMFQATFLAMLPGVLLPYLGAARLKESFIVMVLGLVAGPLVFGLKGIVLGPVFIVTIKDLIVLRLEGEQ